MNIVVLDGYTLNPGDLSWEGLQKLGNVTLYDRSEAGQTAERISNAEIVLTNKTVLGKEIINQATALKYIGVMATGYNVVDIEAAKDKGVIVTNVPAYSTASVAQLVFSFILELANHTALYAASVRDGEWAKSIDFTYQIKSTRELKDKTLGIVGLGEIGRTVATIGLAFGMRVIASHNHPERDKMEGVSFVDLESCFSEADFVTLHIPMRDSNKEFVNAALLAKMKSTACLINTSRGGLIQEQDLADALNSGVISGAGLDVLTSEPPAADNPLLTAKNCLITPHIAWSSVDARIRLMETLVSNVKAFQNGNPKNVVNP